MRLFKSCILMLVFFISCDVKADGIGDMFRLLNERADLLKNISAVSARDDKSIYSDERDADVLKYAERYAKRVGLKSDVVVRTFKQLNSHGYAVMEGWQDFWDIQGPPDTELQLESLERELRSLDRQIIVAIYRSEQDLRQRNKWQIIVGRGRSLLKHEMLPEDAPWEIVALLRDIERLPFSQVPVQERIKASKVLRVGVVSGQYPFAYREQLDWDGLDIQLLSEYASSLSARIEVTELRAGQLQAALTNGSVDVVAGGLDRTGATMQKSFTSPPYYEGGRVLVSRCDDTKKYARSARVNNIATKVLFSPTTPSASYVSENFPKSEQLEYFDEGEMFVLLKTKVGDIIVTDLAAGLKYTELMPELCMLSKGTLTIETRHFALRGDPSFNRHFVKWMNTFRSSGNFQKVIKLFTGGKGKVPRF